VIRVGPPDAQVWRCARPARTRRPSLLAPHGGGRMDRTYSGDVTVLTTAGRMVARVHACFIAHESPGELGCWDGEIWSATGGPLRLQAGTYRIQFPNGTIGELAVQRSAFGAAASGRVRVLGSGGSPPF